MDDRYVSDYFQRAALPGHQPLRRKQSSSVPDLSKKYGIDASEERFSSMLRPSSTKPSRDGLAASSEEQLSWPRSSIDTKTGSTPKPMAWSLKKKRTKQCSHCSAMVNELKFADHQSMCSHSSSAFQTSSKTGSKPKRADSKRSISSFFRTFLRTSKQTRECIICFAQIDKSNYVEHVNLCYQTNMEVPSSSSSTTKVKTPPVRKQEELLQSPSKNSTTSKRSSTSINICFGDLMTQKTDVIVVNRESQYLFNAVCKAAGDSVKTSFERELKKHPKASVIAVDGGPQIPSKRIYFLQWKKSDDDTSVQTSIEQFVSKAIKYAIKENQRHIAFPAIGCGQYGCAISVIAQSMVDAAHRIASTSSISVLFVIELERIDVYDQFQMSIDAIKPPASVSNLISTHVGKGMMEVGQGDIATAHVDVIIASLSSIHLIKAILEAAGEETRRAYGTECENNQEALLFSMMAGNLSCKRIFFLKWQPDDDPVKLRQSLVDLISTVILHMISNGFTSIAFPAIGCGKHRCSVNLVVKSIVEEMKNQLRIRDQSLTVKFIVQVDQENVYDEFCKQVLATRTVDKATSLDSQLPLTWEKGKMTQTRFVLSKHNEEHKTVLRQFNATMKGRYREIVQIERIQNERWYTQYLAHSRDFQKRLHTDTEQRLFHGCPETAINPIIGDCFNRSFAGTNGTSYGAGVYFSSNASYSHSYAKAGVHGERRMFLARVLIGKTTQGNSSMKTRPVGFDSTTDGNHIFVTYHDAQAYAEYLITYK